MFAARSCAGGNIGGSRDEGTKIAAGFDPKEARAGKAESRPRSRCLDPSAVQVLPRAGIVEVAPGDDAGDVGRRQVLAEEAEIDDILGGPHFCRLVDFEAHRKGLRRRRQRKARRRR